MDQLSHKIEVGQVTRVYTHNVPGDYNWETCDVIIWDAIPLDGHDVSDQGPAWRWRVPVVQHSIGNRSGMPWTPRVGDNVLVGFYMNDKPMILGTTHKRFQVPVCRSSANPSSGEDGAYEDWINPDFHNYYDYRLKLVQWLHVPRLYITDSKGRKWPTAFDHRFQDLTKLRPVCFNYLDETKDFYVAWECKAHKANPDCDLCTSNKDGPDNLKCCSECCGEGETFPAMNAWLKILSSDYKGGLECAADLPRRLKYHHPCGSLLCMDSDWPDNMRLGEGIGFEKCNKHRGRIWLEGQEYHDPNAHIHFRAEANLAGEVYPDTPQGYGKFNLSFRSFPTLGAHIELWGKNDLKGRVDIANEEIGLVQTEDVHCGTPDAHVTIKEIDGTIQIHSTGQGGKIYIIASDDILIQSCGGEITLKAAEKITLDAPLVEETNDNQVGGTCTHGACSCPDGWSSI